jgi:hypothetical protein
MKTRHLIVSIALANLFALPVGAAPALHDCVTQCAAHTDKDAKMCTDHCKASPAGGDHACATHCAAQPGDKDQSCALH